MDTSHISTPILWDLGKILNLSKPQFLHLKNGDNGVTCEAEPHSYTHFLIQLPPAPTPAFFPGSYLTHSNHSLNAPGWLSLPPPGCLLSWVPEVGALCPGTLVPGIYPSQQHVENDCVSVSWALG